ncbi:MAG: c-type cytochrome [Rhodothermales bacterium]
MILPGCGQISERDVHQRELVAAGKSSFRAYCAGCHGRTAKGDGPAAEYMTIQPADLTQISARNGGTFPTAMVYRRIEGSDEGADPKMPHWGEIWRGASPDSIGSMEADQKIEELVVFLQSIQVE